MSLDAELQEQCEKVYLENFSMLPDEVRSHVLHYELTEIFRAMVVPAINHAMHAGKPACCDRRVKCDNKADGMLSEYDQSCLVFAARYARARNTGAASMVVRSIISNWDRLSSRTKAQIKGEAIHETAFNHEEWAMLIDKK